MKLEREVVWRDHQRTYPRVPSKKKYIKTIRSKNFITKEIQASEQEWESVVGLYICTYSTALHWHDLLFLESEPHAPEQVRDLLIKIYIKKSYIQNTSANPQGRQSWNLNVTALLETRSTYNLIRTQIMSVNNIQNLQRHYIDFWHSHLWISVTVF